MSARQAQGSICIDIPATRGALDELARMQSLGYSERCVKRRGRASRKILFPDTGSLLRALSFSPTLVGEYVSRVFARRDGSSPTRFLAERFTDESGTLWYVLERDAAGGELTVAARESEDYSVRRKSFVHPLKKTTVRLIDHPTLPAHCPNVLSWQESKVCDVFGWEGADACGVVSLRLACFCTEVVPPDVLALFSQ